MEELLVEKVIKHRIFSQPEIDEIESNKNELAEAAWIIIKDDMGRARNDEAKHRDKLFIEMRYNELMAERKQQEINEVTLQIRSSKFTVKRERLEAEIDELRVEQKEHGKRANLISDLYYKEERQQKLRDLEEVNTRATELKRKSAALGKQYETEAYKVARICKEHKEIYKELAEVAEEAERLGIDLMVREDMASVELPNSKSRRFDITNRGGQTIGTGKIAKGIRKLPFHLGVMLPDPRNTHSMIMGDPHCDPTCYEYKVNETPPSIYVDEAPEVREREVLVHETAKTKAY